MNTKLIPMDSKIIIIDLREEISEGEKASYGIQLCIFYNFFQCLWT
uniref:Uncharacterized protein n=1 Tax=Arundo donax TaxID=35708 RepID=A0A0A9E956_ARUDO